MSNGRYLYSNIKGELIDTLWNVNLVGVGAASVGVAN